jgi:hypothetical protein
MQLVRGPGAEVDPGDAEASRAWVMQHVRQQVKLVGQPQARVYLLGQGFVETLDLDLLPRKEPTAHLGQTFQALRRRDQVERCFLVMGVRSTDEDGTERSWAMVFEQRDTPAGPRWWMAMLEYRADPDSGLGVPAPRWQQSAGETGDPAVLPPFVHELASPPPGARPAEILDASAVRQLDLRFTFGEVPEGSPLPADAKQMVEFAAALTLGDLLAGKLVGTLVVRLVGRAWEVWVLGDEMPASTDEMIRWLANHRLPAAEGVALVQLAILPQDEPPRPGVQIIGEHGGMRAETWAPVSFPQGPDGPKQLSAVHWREPRPIEPDKRWLGVPSQAQLLEPTFQ